MATTTSLTGVSKASQSSISAQNLFQKIQGLQSYLQSIQNDLFKLDQEAKNILDEKNNVQMYLEERAQTTRSKLMGELKVFENEVKGMIENSRKQTQKIDEKINYIKQGQLATMQMVLGLQRRVREVQVQLGGSND